MGETRSTEKSPVQARAQARLTMRGRAVALALFLLLAFALLSAASALYNASQASTGRATPATRYVTVQPGQTLWQIALKSAPSDDPRDTVDRIRSLNGLDSTAVQVGQRLIVPA